MQIRLARTDDAAAIASIYAPYVNETTISFEETPPSPAEMAARMQAVWPRHPWLVATDGDDVLGYAASGPHRKRAAYRWSVEVGLYVSARAHRRGVGRALYEALLDLLTRQGYRTAYAGVTQPNPTSDAFHRALGFEPLGTYRKVGFKDGRWCDVVWSSLRLGDEDAPPTEPRTLTVGADGQAALAEEA